jgi:C-terminal processing protease CtpA/Prc
MASFRPDGRMYDGRGVEVDIEVNPVPQDYIIRGSDTLLDAAIEKILMSR